VAIAAAWAVKEAYWRYIDQNPAPSTPESATALGGRGRVRLLEPPHTQDNYLLQEMGYRIARKHRRRLRWVARLFAFALPFALTLAALVIAFRTGAILAGLAVASAAFGLLVERWLFFAEAKHTVTLYYGAEAV
jgi:DMSO reductase anchor subunit